MTRVRGRVRRSLRPLALLAAGLVGGGAALLCVGLAPTVVVPSAGAATCTSAGGVSVVVDYRELGGSTVTACAPDGGGRSAAAIFDSVGVSITYAQRSPGFVCRVNGVPASDPCVSTSPANAFWGLWWSDGSSGSWTFASSGVGGQTVPAGGSVGWAWQQDRPSGSPVPPSVAPPVAPPSPTPSPTTSSPTPSPTASPTGGAGGSAGTGGSGGKGGSGGSGGSGGKGGGSSPSATPTPTTSGTPSASPSGTPSGTPSESPLPRESPSDSASSTPTTTPSASSESPSDSASSEPSADPTVGSESPSDSGPSAEAGTGEPTAGEPARIPAAVTWSVVGLLAVAIVASALVARRRRGSGAP